MRPEDQRSKNPNLARHKLTLDSIHGINIGSCTCVKERLHTFPAFTVASKLIRQAMLQAAYI